MVFILTVVCLLILLWEGFKILSVKEISNFVKFVNDSSKLNEEEKEKKYKELGNKLIVYLIYAFGEVGYVLTTLLLLLSPLYMIGVLLLSLALFNFIVGKLFKLKVKPTWYYVLDSLVSIIIVVYTYHTVLG